ncbi:MAG: TonB-dependent receptor domain-containing protein [Rhodanobacteraceae bacterium]
MRLDRSELSKAVQTALSLGAVAAVGITGTAFAQNATTTQNNQQQPQTLQTIVVTGSHIRRVDLETSNPVVSVTARQIQNSGDVTVGDLIQDLPSIAGAAESPKVNNGGGSGAAGVSLRGLGSQRTLVLIDGQRMMHTVNGVSDVNSIPVAMIERVDVLKDGASAVYGSDAIGGVVNIILKKNYQGAQFQLGYGQSDHDDATRKSASFVFGQTSDKGSILAGVSYNKQDPIISADRDWSKLALYQYSGAVHVLGSSRNPNGRAYLPDNLKAQYGCADGTVTRTSGSGSSLGDYKCYNGATDSYNFQLLNYDLVPQERTDGFFEGTYRLSENVQAYMDVFTDKTHSSSAIAPLPFDAAVDHVLISKDNMYNPFGVDFGGTAGNELLTRFTGIGQRITAVNTTTAQAIVGLKGNFDIGDKNWQWDVNYNYGHSSQTVHNIGDPLYNASFLAATGPSMMVNGVPTCVGTAGDASSAIAGCVPINLFGNQNDPSVVAAEAPFFNTLFGNNMTTVRSYAANANGPLFDLPAGQMQLAVGLDYRKEYAHNLVDSQRIVTGSGGTCGAPQSVCSSPLQGGFNVKEAYAELFVPILKDVPFFHALNVTLGDRYSKYSDAGSTNNWKVGVEWRPINDLMLRGTVSTVFRAPSLRDLYRGAAGSAPSFADPCIGLDAAELAAHSAACAGVPVNWPGTGLSQTTAVRSGSVAAGVDLKPELGKSFDYGIVYDPHFVPGLSINVDVWRVFLHDTITSPGAQTLMSICFNDNASPICNLITRPNPTSHATLFQTPTVNLGSLYFKGVDLGAFYKLPQVSWLPGSWRAHVEATYLTQANFDTVPGVVEPTHVAGKFDKDFGNFARIRGLGGLDWNLGPWNASWNLRYIGPITVGSADLGQNRSADLNVAGVVDHFGALVYNDFQVGYDIQPINTRIDLGVNNAFDRTPPLITMSNVVNGNTDVNTYDTIGRFYWARVTVKF